MEFEKTELLNLLKDANIYIHSIKKIKHIKKGLTNKIYKITLNNGSILKVRITNKDVFINRDIEKHIENNLGRKFIYYNKNGDYITDWLKGKNIYKREYKNKKLWLSIKEFINLFRDLNKDINIKYDVNVLEIKKEILEKQTSTFKEMYNKYLSIISDFNNENTVITHTDISRSNIIKSDDGFHVIDFEWVSKFHKYWDIANLMKDFELNLNNVKKINILLEYNLSELIKIIYAVHIYTIIWTFKVKENKSIVNYRNKIFKKSLYWYKKIAL